MDFTLSPADRSDAKEIFRLNRELIDRYENVARIDYAKVMKIVQSGIKEHIREYQRIMRGGETAGYLHVTENPDSFELEDLFLYPKFQNRGIGTAIMQKILASSQKPVLLYVFVRNEGAVRLYKRLGFEVVETVKETRYRMVYKR